MSYKSWAMFKHPQVTKITPDISPNRDGRPRKWLSLTPEKVYDVHEYFEVEGGRHRYVRVMNDEGTIQTYTLRNLIIVEEKKNEVAHSPGNSDSCSVRVRPEGGGDKRATGWAEAAVSGAEAAIGGTLGAPLPV